ncbi:hypothetical protein BI334_16280 [Moorena producens 3L]|nr:hypothetical protein BI334_16280 [Moorena producens 3L]
MLTKQEISTISKRYDERLELEGDWAKVGYVSNKSQLLRFQVLSKIAQLVGKPFHQASVLDVGMGLGGFYQYLLEQGQVPRHYSGVDILTKMVNLAQQKFPPEQFPCVTFEKANILCHNLRPANYVICSGALTPRVTNNKKYFISMIGRMIELATFGVACNFLTIRCTKPKPELFYYDLKIIKQWVGETISANHQVYFHDNYHPFDVTMFVIKKITG